MGIVHQTSVQRGRTVDVLANLPAPAERQRRTSPVTLPEVAPAAARVAAMEAALHTLEGRVTVLEAAFLEQHDLNIRLREEIEMIRGAHAERQRLYRARGGSKIPDDLRRAVLERDGNACLACGAVEYLACDHVVPVSKGGPTELGNLQTLCRACNSRKKDVFKRYGKSGAMLRSAAAERQRRYRERKKHGTDPQR